MNTRIKPIKQEPIGTRQASGFVDYADGSGGYELFDVAVYPSDPRREQLASARKREGIGLRELSRVLHIQPVELSGLEHGGYTLSDDDWTQVLAAVELLSSLLALSKTESPHG